MPLIFNLHPYGATMFDQASLSRMNAKADAEGFVVVYPQALGDPPSWHGPLPGLPGQADRDFFVELLAYLESQVSVDPARIYATGLSNGGTMSYALGCAMADVLAAIAPVAGGHVAHDQCRPAAPISVLVIHGTDDPVIPFGGRGTESAPVHVWLEAWAAHNGCNAVPDVTYPRDSVRKETWADCEAGVEVTLYALEGGGHLWPGSAPGSISGTFDPLLDATEAIWSFFEAHPKASPAQGP
jgi:polyhydroxybutyrate depolymerase